jgi:predicted DNA-binding transcriptional regulator AlpA
MTVHQEILTERQVSDWIGLSEPTLFRHRRDGTGPLFIRLSARRVAYRKSDVEVWLSARTIERARGGGRIFNGSPEVPPEQREDRR